MAIRLIGAGVLAAALVACGSTPAPKADATAFRPSSGPLTAAERSLRDRAQAAVEARLGDAARGIRVQVEGTSLWLTGEALDGVAVRQARDAAHTVPGVTRVDVSGIAVR